MGVKVGVKVRMVLSEMSIMSKKTIRPNEKCGFTLAEMLVVVAVIGLLVAILVPMLGNALAYARYVGCTSNLEKLGQAYATMYSTRRMTGLTGIGSLGAGWPKMFQPYVAGSKSVICCPTKGGEGIMEQASLDQYYNEVYVGGAYQGAMALSESDSPFVWKLSQTQYQDFLNAGKGRGYNYTGYKPDNNVGSYYYMLEDNAWRGGGDMDFWDVNYLIETDGINVKITVVPGYTVYTHNLIHGNGPGKKILIADTMRKAGETVEIPGKGVASYGINTVADQFDPGDGDKILLMDYDFVTVAASQYDETGDRAGQLIERWQPDPNDPTGPLKFARHMRKANVLFTDGTVHLMRPDDIHPNNPESCAKYWDPR